MNCKFNGCTDYAGHEGAHQMARANPKKSRCRLCGELPQTAAQRRTAKAAGYRPCPSCSNLSVGSRKSSTGAKRFLRERSQKTETAQKKSAPSAYRNKTGRVSGSVFVPDLPLRPLRLGSSLKGIRILAMVAGTPTDPKSVTDLKVSILSNRMKIKVLGYAKDENYMRMARKPRKMSAEAKRATRRRSRPDQGVDPDSRYPDADKYEGLRGTIKGKIFTPSNRKYPPVYISARLKPGVTKKAMVYRGWVCPDGEPVNNGHEILSYARKPKA